MSVSENLNYNELIERTVRALDFVKYNGEIEDGEFDAVEYRNAEKARRDYEHKEAAQNTLEETEESFNEIESLLSEIDEENLGEDCQEQIEEIKETARNGSSQSTEGKEHLERHGENTDDIKYNGESESGPGMLITLVNGPSDELVEYVERNSNNPRINKDILEGVDFNNLDPESSEYSQQLYDLEHHDGAIVLGEMSDGYAVLPDTYNIPESDFEDYDELLHEKAGKKHQAAVDAMHADIRDGNEELEVTSIILSATDGNTRIFRNGELQNKFEYDGEEINMVPDAWSPDAGSFTAQTPNTQSFSEIS